MRISEFWRRMDVRFGATYARSVAQDHRLTVLGATVNDALESGVSAKEVWRAVCADFDVASQLR
jgi:hypothetical protein